MEAVLTGPQGRTLLGSGELTIGCDPDNQLVVNDMRTAAHQALIRPAGTGYTLQDLGSANGTIVNGRWLEANVAYHLQPGDVIQIGESSFTYEEFQSPASIPTGVLGVGVGHAPTQPPGNVPAFDAARLSRTQAASYAGMPLAPPSAQARPQQLPYTSQPWVPGGVTAYPPQQQLWQQDLRRFTLALGVMLVAIVVVSLIAFVVNRSTPDKTLDTFCNALLSGNGQLAYNQLSTTYQNQQGGLFIGEITSNKATACTHTTAIISGSSARATLTTSFSLNSGSSNSPTNSIVMLIQDANGVWKINALQSQ
ncbi:MAG TPA: FHA domain-containing protein [Ktedonobacteraceae bacterium]|nr:FHA domain-containing protein [Ktedonobacteraceae bacterium]